MIRKFQKEAAKTSFFQDLKITKFNEVSSTLKKFKGSMKDSSPKNKKSFYKSNRYGNINKINSIRSTSRRGIGNKGGMKSTTKLDGTLRKNYTNKAKTKVKKDDTQSFRNSKYFNKKLKIIQHKRNYTMDNEYELALDNNKTSRIYTQASPKEKKNIEIVDVEPNITKI